ncbi:MAG: hypothetical protein J6C92_14790 [Bacteroidaceae bacterium]|nr:hypothetical protein [Bacteroidaceae bacterium]
MKLYIRPITASKNTDKTISRFGSYELVKTSKGELYVYYPGGFVKFTGSGHPDIPEEVWEKFAPYTALGKRLLNNGESPYDEIYD